MVISKIGAGLRKKRLEFASKSILFILVGFFLASSVILSLFFLIFPPAEASNVNINAVVPSAQVCGNNIREGSEQCDGTDSGNCASGICYPAGHALECNCQPVSSCFVEGTNISLPGGLSKSIEEIRPGDYVLSYNLQASRLESALVLKTFKYKVGQYLTINEEIRVTSNHPFYIDGSWKNISEAETGDRIFNQDGQYIRIDSIKIEKGDFFVYNLEVAGNHNYFAQSYLVHNKGGCTPNCTGKECGPDGCGGLCGSCDPNQECISGQCIFVPYCGDGIINRPEEECEPPNSPGCSADCKIIFAIISHGVPLSTITDFSAVINWATNLESNSILEWRKAGSSWDNSREGISGTNYSQTISNLLFNTVYNYRITAVRSDNNSQQSQVSGSFRTNWRQIEICDNGIDDNGNGLIDYLDPDCYCEAIYSCTPWQPLECPQSGIQTRICEWINSNVCWNFQPVLPTSRTCSPDEICTLFCGPCQILNIDLCICEDVVPCCGNGICEYWSTPPEDYISCPQDCILDCIPSWQCDEWGPCVNGIENRQCYDQHACGNNLNRPDEIRSCLPGCEISCGICQTINLEQCICENLVPCCGNLICEMGEDENNCPQDCFPICIPNWLPSGWSECINGIQTRTYRDLNNCPYSLYPPPDKISCVDDCVIACGICQRINLQQCICETISPCCGNKICEVDSGEDAINCPIDCGFPPSLKFYLPECMDGIDNDGDGFIDYPEDPGCFSPYDNSEFSLIKAAEKIFAIINDPQVEQINRVATPILITAVAVNTFATFSFFNFLSYLQYFITQPFAFLFRRRRKKWGIVYNSLTKQPVDLAIVRLYKKENAQLIQSRVTDKIGRYSFLVDIGRYYIVVTKPRFDFPTKYLKKENKDAKYLDLYHGQPIEITKRQSSIAYNIPIDPQEKVMTAGRIIVIKYLRKLQYIVAFSAVPLALISVIISPGWLTFGFLGIHFLLFVLFYRLGFKKAPKSWGKVFDKLSKKPVKNAVVRIYDRKYNKLLETRITDSTGRYSFLVNNNIYYLTVDKSGYQNYKSMDIDLTGDEETAISMDIGLVENNLEKSEINQLDEFKNKEQKQSLQPHKEETLTSKDQEVKGSSGNFKKGLEVKTLSDKDYESEVGRESLETLLESKSKSGEEDIKNPLLDEAFQIGQTLIPDLKKDQKLISQNDSDKNDFLKEKEEKPLPPPPEKSIFG